MNKFRRFLLATASRYAIMAGSTSAAVVNPTVVGVNGGTLTYTYTTIAGVLLANAPLIVTYSPCLAATGQNVAIVASMPSLGSGNTNTTISIQGYQTRFP